MRNRPTAGTVFVAALILAACKEPTLGCAGVGYTPLIVAVRDQAGNPQALGATVTVNDGTYREHDATTADPLNIPAADTRGGATYDIQVTKPYYSDSWVRGVATPGGGCIRSGPIPVTVPVQLSLVPGAPPVRSLYLLPQAITLDRPSGRTFAFAPYVDVNAGLSRAVYWRLTGDTASVGFDASTGVLTYRCLPTSGYLTVTATAVADSSFVTTARVNVQGHPAATGDPPCS